MGTVRLKLYKGGCVVAGRKSSCALYDPVSYTHLIMKEYSHAYEPGSGPPPYYAILDPANRKLYESDLERVSHITNFHPVGRLAEYRYYDMDAATASALNLSDEIIACHA